MLRKISRLFKSDNEEKRGSPFAVFMDSSLDLVAKLKNRGSTALLNEATSHYGSIRYVYGNNQETARQLLEIIIRCQTCIERMWQEGDAYVLLANALSIASVEAALRDPTLQEHLAELAGAAIFMWRTYTDERGMHTKNRAIGEKFYSDIVVSSKLGIPGGRLKERIPAVQTSSEPWAGGNQTISIVSTSSFDEVRSAVKKAYGIE